MNNNFNFQQKYITNSNFRYTVIPLSREQQGPLLSLVCFINNDPTDGQLVYFHSEHFQLVFPRGILLESNFLIWGLNSFQQLAISTPFSRFIRMFGEKLFPGFMQSIKIASLIFLFLQCGSKSRNTRFSQSIICFLFFFKCCAKPFVLCLHLIAYSCWYLRKVKNCWVSPR